MPSACVPSYIVRVNDITYGQYSTPGDAYKNARALLPAAETGVPVGFTDIFGHFQSVRISRIEVLGRLPRNGEEVRHARSWWRTRPAGADSSGVDPLEPMPRTWHIDDLPDGWYDGIPETRP